jgi:endonuclease/exonuclease/phosphatase family metal-dependent hydrolase
MRRVHIIFLVVCATVSGCISSTGIPGESSENRKTIRIGTYNVENMFDNIDDPMKEDGPPTSPERLQSLAEVIKSTDCDILALEEVENIELLQSFNANYLNGEYPETVLIEGNDLRGIDVAVLSRIHLIDIESHKGREANLPGREHPIRFSRDLLTVSWLDSSSIKWTMMMTHLKSGNTEEDRILRTGQIKAITEICRDEGFVDRWGRGFLILAGDLNAQPGSPELTGLNSIPFTDPAREIQNRKTHKSGRAYDYIILSPDADERYVVGSVNIFHDSETQKASDHYPVYLDVIF